MDVGEICNRDVAVAYRDTPLAEAAQIMRERHVGSLVVVVDRLSGEVMSRDLVTLREHDSIGYALRLMRSRGVRRLPVLSHSGALAGILTMDDLLGLIAEELGDFAGTIDRERLREIRARR
jgi:CBS domain-containing protein